MLNTVLEKFRPLARSIKYGRLLRRAEKDARAQPSTPLPHPVSFIVGCGRSGTTILGKLLAEHPDVRYLFEPYHLWRAIIPESDMILLYGETANPPHCILDNTVVGEDEVRRFNACMHAERSRAGNPHVALIEKTPINAMRIPMLHALSPESPLLHLVRNGIDVIRSINRLASTNTYQIRGKGEWNQWWGRDHCKWKALAADAIAHEHFANEIEHVSTNTEMGAIEWLISLREIEKQRVALGRRLIDVRYNDLTSNPAIQLERICSHFDIPSNAAWLKHSSAKLDPARKNKGEPVILPPKMCEAFNHFQQQYGFEGEATCR